MKHRTRRPTKTVYLGLDLSLNSSGYVFFSPSEGILEQGTIKQTKLRGVERLSDNRGKLNALIHKYVDRHGVKVLACIEGYAMGVRGGRLASIGEWGGIARLLLSDYSVPFLECPPNNLKKFVTGKGSGGKDIMLLETFKRFGESFSNDDICDAYGLARVCEAWHNKDGDWTKFQLESLEKIK